jgi:alanine racemase
LSSPLSFVELSRSNARHNIAEFRRLLHPGTQIVTVVKGNAYGHGMPEMIGMLEDVVDYFQVDDLLELRELRRHSQKPTLVLGYVARGELEEAVTLGGELAIYDETRLPCLQEIATKLGIAPQLHLKIDTYLGRQGILPDDLERFLDLVAGYPALKLVGVYSHFANIEDTTDFSHALKQIQTFEESVRAVRARGYLDVKTHISSTSGVLAYENGAGHNLLVRIGIGTYGMWPSERLRKQHVAMDLRPVMRWVTHVAQVKTVPPGFPIGYGLTYQTMKPTRVAIIPQGYSDGYPRAFSNRGEVLIRGTRCGVLGRVAMNMFPVDVTHLPDLRPEEEVVLLGSQGGETIAAEELAETLDTINYEVTTQVSPLLPRVVV